MILAVFAAFSVALLAGAFVVSRTFTPRNRLVFWLVILLTGSYLVPMVYRGAERGYRVGAEIREQQGR